MTPTEPSWEVAAGPEMTAAFWCVRTTAYWSLHRCDQFRVLCVRRSDERIANAGAMVASWAPIHEAAEEVPLEEWSLCLDMRLAPPSHDPAVEGALRQSRGRLSSRTQRFAVILQSAVGVLHATRLVQPDKTPTLRIYRDDEAAAIRFLVTGE